MKVVQLLQEFQLLLRKSASRTILDCSDLAFSPLHIFAGCLYRAASAFMLYFGLSVKMGVLSRCSGNLPTDPKINKKMRVIFASQRFLLGGLSELSAE